MDRLQAERQRLFFLPGVDAGQTRTLVLHVRQPVSWDAIGRAWQGVQAEWGWPAPAIAISGDDAYQLWFSLAQPVPIAQAQLALQRLRERFLPEVPAARVELRVQPEPLPPFEAAPGRWSAFVAPDLAPLFSEERFLDLTPGADAQAELLSRIASVKPQEWQRALVEPAATPAAAPSGAHDDPRRFLLSVMNDPAVDLRLRIEAAKALLPYPTE